MRAAFDRSEWIPDGRQAFTLPNLMISISLFTLVIGGIVSSQIFGLRLSQIGQLVLGANQVNPQFSQYLYEDMRQVHSVLIGQGDNQSFTEAGDEAEQKGNALQIYPGSDTNEFVRYYVDAGDLQLKRRTEVSGSSIALSGFIKNTNDVFRAEDFRGNILTNKVGRKVVALHMEYESLKGSGAQFGPGNYYESYEYNTRFTPRTQE